MQLVASDVGFAYPGRPVFSGVNLRVYDGGRLGVVGDNGSGKSTLLGVLAGRLQPVSGEVRRVGTLTLVEQEMTAPPGETVGDIVRDSLQHLRQLAAELTASAEAISSASCALRPLRGAAQAPSQNLGRNLDQSDHESARLTEQSPPSHNGNSSSFCAKSQNLGRNLDQSDRESARLAALLAKAEYLAAWDADRRVDEALTRLGAPREFDRRLDTLSVGERYRVRLACALVERSDLLLLDEPTNHLDASAIAYLTTAIKTWHGAVVLVTHDRQLLDDVATAILDLDPSMDGRPTLYGRPGYDAYRSAKDAALVRWRQRYTAEQKRAAELAEVLDASYEGLSDEWRPPKGSQKHRRATRARIHVKAADRAIEKLKAEAIDVPEPPLELAFPTLPADQPPSSPVVEPVFQRASIGSDVASELARRSPQSPVETTRPLVSLANPVVNHRVSLPDATIAIPPSGRLLVVGPNGAGKSTLLSALAGRLPLDGGQRRERSGLRIGYLGQEDDLTGESTQAAITGAVLTGFDAVATRVLELLARGELDPEQLHPIASLGLLSEADLDRPLNELSVGQRRRYELARTLVSAPHLLVLDEPTNHLSIDLVDELTRALDATEAAVVVATHDRRMQAELAHWPTLKLDG